MRSSAWRREEKGKTACHHSGARASSCAACPALALRSCRVKEGRGCELRGKVKSGWKGVGSRGGKRGGVGGKTACRGGVGQGGSRRGAAQPACAYPLLQAQHRVLPALPCLALGALRGLEGQVRRGAPRLAQRALHSASVNAKQGGGRHAIAGGGSSRAARFTALGHVPLHCHVQGHPPRLSSCSPAAELFLFYDSILLLMAESVTL